MAEGIELVRKTMQGLTGRGVGLNVKLPRYLSGQQVSVRVENEIAALPVDDSNRYNLQDPNSGQQFFRMDMHWIDDNPMP